MSKILPEHMTKEGDETENESISSLYQKTSGASKLGDGATFVPKSIYAKRRQEVKEKVVKDVLEAILPDIGSFNMDDLIYGRKEKKRHWLVNLAMALGIINITVLEAVLTGSKDKLVKSLLKNKLAKSPDPLLANQRDVGLDYELYFVLTLARYQGKGTILAFFGSHYPPS